MRKAIVVAAVGLVVILVVVFYPSYVIKPEKDGTGPLAVVIGAEFPAPEYHSPLDWWQTHHYDIVNRGDIVRSDCLYCHEVEKSCNNCHGFVGVDPIVDER
jgi:hypothetical protein